MHSLLHIFWTGPSFPYSVRHFIKTWVKYFRDCGSEFQLVLWMTNDSFHAFKSYMAQNKLGNVFNEDGWEHVIPQMYIRFNKVKLNFNSFYIAVFEPLLARQHATIQNCFHMLKDNDRLTSASNIARMVITNYCSGIYSDIDYLYPNYLIRFPNNINLLLQGLQGASSIGVYFPIVEMSSGSYLIENQCVIVDPLCKGNLGQLFDELDRQIYHNYHKAFVKEVESEHQFQDDYFTKCLKKSFFTRGAERTLLEAFKAGSLDLFCDANEKLYKFEELSGSFYRPKTSSWEQDPSMLESGMRHHHYEVTSTLFYEIPQEFFEDHLKVSRQQFYENHWQKFCNYFDREHLMSQFRFRGFGGGRVGMYSWANPGYARLTKLEKTAKLVEKRHIESRQKVTSAPLLRLIIKFHEGRPGKYSPSGLLETQKLRFDELSKLIQGIHKNYFEYEEAIVLLKNLLRIALVKENYKLRTDMAEYALFLLNHAEYAELRKLIDPEKDQLDYQDLKDFAAL